MEIDTTHETKTTTCSVCLDTISPSINYAKTLCNHEFCFTCMIQHLHRYTTCPLCRSEIIKQTYQFDNLTCVILDIEDDTEPDNNKNRCYDVFVKICIVIIYYLYLEAFYTTKN